MKKLSVLVFVCLLLISSALTSVPHIKSNDELPFSGVNFQQDEPLCCDRLSGSGSGNNITFRDDHIMLVNGDPFFPIGIYYGAEDEWNCVVADVRNPCELENYSGDIMHITTSYPYEESILCTSHPNFLCWITADEPVWKSERGEWDYQLDELLELYTNLTEDDPNHPIWINFAAADTSDDLDIWIQKRRQWSQAADIVSVDVYPKWANPGPGDDQCCGCGPNGCGLWCVLDNCNLSVIGDYVDVLINNVTEGQKPVWIIPQGWGAVNEHEIRFQSYQAIIHGATGILFWQSGYGFRLVQPDANNVAQELTDLHEVLVAPTIHANVTDTPGIETIVKKIDDTYFILSVNREAEPEMVTADFDLTSLGITANGYAELLNEDATIAFTNGGFSVDFNAFDTHIIQIKPWWDFSWSNSVKMSIDHSLVDADQTDFPILVYRNADVDIAACAQSDGDDIVFVDNTNTIQLDHEIEYYNESTGEVIAWVRTPYLSSTGNTTLNMYYGNPYCVSQQNAHGVWDSSYVMVQHLNESPANGVSGHLDSTSNDNDGTPFNFGDILWSTTAASGVIDGADRFDGVDDYIDCGGSTSIDSITNAMTLETWVVTDAGVDWGGGISKTLHYMIYTQGQARLFIYDPDADQSDGNGYVSTSAYVLDDGWQYLVGTYDSCDRMLRVYVNGSEVTSLATTGGDGEIEPSAAHLFLSRYGNKYSNQTVDEVRVSNNARSPSWINTTYHNIKDTQGFLCFNELIADAHGPYTGFNDMPIRFSGSASGSLPVYSYLWDFGDGNTSNWQFPTHFYPFPGDYPVTLTVVDSQGATAIDSTLVHVDMAPLFANAHGPYHGFRYEPVCFSGFVTGGVPPYVYHWDFGDGNTSDRRNPSHTYMHGGEYIATFTVTDSRENSINGTAPVIVDVKPSMVWVDDDFNSSYPGWGYNQFDTIQNGIDGVETYGIVTVNNGSYFEDVVINRTMDVIGHDKDDTFIIGSGEDYSVVVGSSAQWINISGFTIQDGYFGLGLWANHTSITGMVVENHSLGIYVDGSSYNRIMGNIIRNITQYSGIQIGSFFYSSTDNIVSSNVISCCPIGLYIGGSSTVNNLIYHNCFINNTQQASDGGGNLWNDTYPIGGNYWDDHPNRVDISHGPEQNISGSDGIVDAPYNITDYGIQDNYPFVDPYGWEGVCSSLSFMTRSPGGLTTCPTGDGLVYEYITVTVNDFNGNPISGISAEHFEFSVTPTNDTNIPDGADLSCTFHHVDTETNSTGEIRFTIAGDTAINGTINITATVMGMTINEVTTLECRSFDQNIDGVVDLYELGFFGTKGWPIPQNLDCDYNWDDVVNLVDFTMFAQHFGHTS